MEFKWEQRKVSVDDLANFLNELDETYILACSPMLLWDLKGQYAFVVYKRLIEEVN